jgi:hypothetical protein
MNDDINALFKKKGGKKTKKGVTSLDDIAKKLDKTVLLQVCACS